MPQRSEIANGYGHSHWFFSPLLFNLFIILLGGLYGTNPAMASGWSTTDDFPYTLQPATELALIPSGATLLTLGVYLRETMALPSAQTIRKLNKADLPAFDRSATYNFSETASTMSDVGLISMRYMPLLLTLPEIRRLRTRWRNIVTVMVMYGESVIWTMGVTRLTKALAKRPRPFMYNSQIPMSQKLNESFTSFFSGHTSDTFCSAVFLATIFSETHPESPWRVVVWGASMTIASLTGVMRYAAGKHFPSDVLVGAAVGSLFGYMVPFLHLKSLWNNDVTPVAILPNVSRRYVGFNVMWGL